MCKCVVCVVCLWWAKIQFLFVCCFFSPTVWSSYNPVTSHLLFSTVMYILLITIGVLAIVWVICVFLSPLLDEDCVSTLPHDLSSPSKYKKSSCKLDRLVGRTCLSCFQALVIIGVARFVATIYTIGFIVSHSSAGLLIVFAIYLLFSICIFGPVISFIEAMCCCMKTQPSPFSIPPLCCFSRLIDV